ncbi:MAG: OmpH family outer membrane protein [Sphingobacteriales bacterium]|nr:MAG: OmpH family outer membrane protein [Sphingobacteriales bacterium]
MKKIILGAVFVLCSGVAAMAQKYCVIDSKYILDKVPEYATAQKQLDNLSEGWQKEVDVKMEAVDQMYKSYQAERAMLNESMRAKREAEIVAKEKEAKDLQKRYFGYEGELFKKRQTMIKPIQDRVFNTVQQYATSRGFDIVYDKSGGITIFYADPKLDKSEEVIKLVNKK